MKDWIKALLSESPLVSWMRFACTVSLICSIFFGSLAVALSYLQKDYSSAMSLTGMFLGAAFSSKLIQKPFEAKNVDTSSSDSK